MIPLARVNSDVVETFVETRIGEDEKIEAAVTALQYKCRHLPGVARAELERVISQLVCVIKAKRELALTEKIFFNQMPVSLDAAHVHARIYGLILYSAARSNVPHPPVNPKTIIKVARSGILSIHQVRRSFRDRSMRQKPIGEIAPERTKIMYGARGFGAVSLLYAAAGVDRLVRDKLSPENGAKLLHEHTARENAWAVQACVDTAVKTFIIHHSSRSLLEEMRIAGRNLDAALDVLRLQIQRAALEPSISLLSHWLAGAAAAVQISQLVSQLAPREMDVSLNSARFTLQRLEELTECTVEHHVARLKIRNLATTKLWDDGLKICVATEMQTEKHLSVLGVSVDLPSSTIIAPAEKYRIASEAVKRHYVRALLDYHLQVPVYKEYFAGVVNAADIWTKWCEPFCFEEADETIKDTEAGATSPIECAADQTRRQQLPLLSGVLPDELRKSIVDSSTHLNGPCSAPEIHNNDTVQRSKAFKRSSTFYVDLEPPIVGSCSVGGKPAVPPRPTRAAPPIPTKSDPAVQRSPLDKMMLDWQRDFVRPCPKLLGGGLGLTETDLVKSPKVWSELSDEARMQKLFPDVKMEVIQDLLIQKQDDRFAIATALLT